MRAISTRRSVSWRISLKAGNQPRTSAIYAERLFTSPRIGSLSEAAATDALVLPAREEGVEYAGEAVERIMELSEAYPYFLQEYGRHV